MKFIMQINGSDYLLDHQQLARITDIVQDSEHLYTKWVGKDKGFYGPESELTAELRQTKPSRDFNSIRVMSDREYDALVTLIAMRKDMKEN